jgi:hypothetical protein
LPAKNSIASSDNLNKIEGSMGADIIGWRNCSLQRDNGREGFLWKLKLLSMREMVETQVPEHQRHQLRMQLRGTNRQSIELNYQTILEELSSFENGFSECASCPIAFGQPLGCHKYITYPVDGVFEELVFNYFCLQLPVKDSICDQLYQDFVSKFPSSNTSWHRMRGNSQQGGLASLTVPLKFEWICNGSKRYVDSAQILGALFLELDNKASVVGYTSFWMELVNFGRDIRNSRTLDEIRTLLPMLVAMVPIAVNEGGIIVVDG